MKKIILTIMILIGLISCSDKGKTEKKENKETVVNNTNKTTNTKNDYEKALLERMDALQKKLQPALDLGVTADMNNAEYELEEAWNEEMKKIYNLIMEKLPEKEKEKLQAEQKSWEESQNKEDEKPQTKSTDDDDEITEGTMANMISSNSRNEEIKKRTLELVKMYNNLD